MKEHSQLKTLILCADDFAQSEQISYGILRLAEKKHLSAVSCMSNSQLWSEHAPLLKPYLHQVDAGLHINLSDGSPLSSAESLSRQGAFIPYKELLLKALTRRLDPVAVKAEISAQLHAFKNSLGCWPKFIDGHRHCHLLPMVQDAIIELYQDIYPEKSAYIRLPSNGWWRSFHNFPKASIIHLLGAKKLQQQLMTSEIPYNPSFSGIYLFRGHKKYSDYFARFLNQSENNGIIMCHPGLEDEGSQDILSKARWSEFQFFMQDDFLHLLEKRGWRLA